MIERLRRLFGRSDPLDDLIASYHDAPSDEELAHIEDRLRAAGVDIEELRSVRETTRLLKSAETVEAPRSFALTPEMLAARGYSDSEIEKTLNPQSGAIRFRLRNAAVFVPVAIVGLVMVGAAVLLIGELSDYVIDRQEEAVPEVELSFDVATARPAATEAPTAIAAAAAQPASSAATAVAASMEEASIETMVEVEKEVIREAEVESVIERTVVVDLAPAATAGLPVVERKVEKVEVEKVVEVEGETIVEIVEEIVEVERAEDNEAVHTVVVEKEAEAALMSEAAMEVVEEATVEAVPTPEPEDTFSEPERYVEPASASVVDEETATPTVVPCMLPPEASPTASTMATVSETPEPTATVSPIPTCTPTPTPTPTATPSTTSTPN